VFFPLYNHIILPRIGKVKRNFETFEKILKLWQLQKLLLGLVEILTNGHLGVKNNFSQRERVFDISKSVKIVSIGVKEFVDISILQK
jgi:hypothetical protein